MTGIAPDTRCSGAAMAESLRLAAVLEDRRTDFLSAGR